ncbi:MAG: hypothetical protein RXP86_08085 [Acidilobus sp.]
MKFSLRPPGTLKRTVPLAFLASGGESTSRLRSSSSSTSAFLSLRTTSSALSTPTSYRGGAAALKLQGPGELNSCELEMPA